LAENGLFDHLETLPVLSGYYTTLHVMLLLAEMALCRIKAVESLQYEAPGELGKLLGLDRIPEVRCLRKKLSQLSQEEVEEVVGWDKRSAGLPTALIVPARYRRMLLSAVKRRLGRTLLACRKPPLVKSRSLSGTA
jgi:hypothetical protein